MAKITTIRTTTHKILTVKAKTLKTLKVNKSPKVLPITTPMLQRRISIIIKTRTINKFNPIKMTIPILIKEEAGPKDLKTKKPSSNKSLKAIKSWWSWKWPSPEKLKEERADPKVQKINPNKWDLKVGIKLSIQMITFPLAKEEKDGQKEARTK